MALHTHRIICKSCNEIFFPSGEDLALVSEGYIQMPTICEDCSDMQEQGRMAFDEFSDADPGL